MVHVAREMQRREMSLPLLIGGATTSAKHTAVKIAPNYRNVIVYVPDASRCAGVVDRLMNLQSRKELDRENRKNQQQLVRSFERRSLANLVPYEQAVAARFPTDWNDVPIDRPAFLGTRILDVPLETLVDYIDWSPFFLTWELKGKYPAILNDPKLGEAARRLLDDGRALLDRIVKQRLLTARAVYGFWPAAAVGDDIVLYTDESRTVERARLHTLRQQWERKGQKHFHALADYIAPAGSGREDYIGAFAVTAGHGVDAMAAAFEADHDDYQSIMVKALADRLAEALAEWSHRKARADWGYGNSENLDIADLLREKYRGIRPAPGYPAQPDHSEKATLWQLLDPLFRTPEDTLLRGRSTTSRSSRTLRRPQRHVRRTSPALASAQSRLRPGHVVRTAGKLIERRIAWEVLDAQHREDRLVGNVVDDGFPKILIGGENIRTGRRHDEPGPRFQFFFKLSFAPAGIAAEHLQRRIAPGDQILERLALHGKVKSAGDLLLRKLLVRVDGDHGADQRSAQIQRLFGGTGSVGDLFPHVADGGIARPIQHDAKSPVLIVLENENDRLGKI
jgi:hypothetical protein